MKKRIKNKVEVAVVVVAVMKIANVGREKGKKGKRSRTRSRSRSPKRSSGRKKRSRSRSSRGRRARRSRSLSRSRGRRSSPPPRGPGRYEEADTPCKVIGVFGMSQATEKADLEDIFSKYGNIEKINLILDHHTLQSRGFAFIYYETVDEAIRAKQKCNGMIVDGRKIRIDYSITEGGGRKDKPRRGSSEDR